MLTPMGTEMGKRREWGILPLFSPLRVIFPFEWPRSDAKKIYLIKAGCSKVPNELFNKGGSIVVVEAASRRYS